MQTFLPYADFRQSAKVLDMKRLGKQRVEVLQLLNSFHKPDYKGWKNHPAREMWRGYEDALVYYGLCICEEWISRGYKDTCFGKIGAYFSRTGTGNDSPIPMPKWIGREDVHLSHKSNLIKKFPEHYKPFWPEIPDNIEYVWPTNN